MATYETEEGRQGQLNVWLQIDADNNLAEYSDAAMTADLNHISTKSAPQKEDDYKSIQSLKALAESVNTDAAIAEQLSRDTPVIPKAAEPIDNTQDAGHEPGPSVASPSTPKGIQDAGHLPGPPDATNSIRVTIGMIRQKLAWPPNP